VQRLIAGQPLGRPPLVEVIRKLFSAWIGARVGDVNTSFSELVMGRLALVPGADEGDITPTASNQFAGGFEDPFIVSFGKRDPTAGSHSSSFESFKKAHNSSQAAIVTQ
jgi:hypothetical protein